VKSTQYDRRMSLICVTSATKMEPSEETNCASGFEDEDKTVVYLHITPTSPSASADVWSPYEWRTREESMRAGRAMLCTTTRGGSFDEQYGSKENRIILRLSFIFLRFFACLLYVVAAAAGACLPLSLSLDYTCLHV
jgi:hypothetical protein